jgi:hypothetical protein
MMDEWLEMETRPIYTNKFDTGMKSQTGAGLKFQSAQC